MRASRNAAQGQQGHVVFQIACIAAEAVDTLKQSLREVMKHDGPRQSVQRLSRQFQESFGSELFSRGRANLSRPIRGSQDHVAWIQPHTLLVVRFTGDESERESFQTFS